MSQEVNESWNLAHSKVYATLAESIGQMIAYPYRTNGLKELGDLFIIILLFDNSY